MNLKIITIPFIFFFLLLPNVHSNDQVDKIDQILKSDHRSDKNKKRDMYRNPKETLNFFGFKDDISVIEVTPGRGWYTEILAPSLKSNGKFYALIYDSKTAIPYLRKLNKFYTDKLAKNPDFYSEVKILQVEQKNPVLKIPKKVDLVLTFRNVHNWAKGGSAQTMFESFFNSLKKGGVLGVVEHRATPGTELSKQIKSGYMTEKYVKDLAKSVGFKFVGSSNVNNNPKDKKNYPGGVWTLLPNLRGINDKQKEEFLKIGESDRMTLKFVKP